MCWRPAALARAAPAGLLLLLRRRRRRLAVGPRPEGPCRRSLPLLPCGHLPCSARARALPLHGQPCLLPLLPGVLSSARLRAAAPAAGLQRRGCCARRALLPLLPCFGLRCAAAPHALAGGLLYLRHAVPAGFGLLPLLQTAWAAHSEQGTGWRQGCLRHKPQRTMRKIVARAACCASGSRLRTAPALVQPRASNKKGQPQSTNGQACDAHRLPRRPPARHPPPAAAAAAAPAAASPSAAAAAPGTGAAACAMRASRGAARRAPAATPRAAAAPPAVPPSAAPPAAAPCGRRRKAASEWCREGGERRTQTGEAGQGTNRQSRNMAQQALPQGRPSRPCRACSLVANKKGRTGCAHLILPRLALLHTRLHPRNPTPHLRAVSGSRCSRFRTSTAGRRGATKLASRPGAARRQRDQSNSCVREQPSARRCSSKTCGQLTPGWVGLGGVGAWTGSGERPGARQRRSVGGLVPRRACSACAYYSN